MADTATPTKPGAHNFLHPPKPDHDPARRHHDLIFGDESPIIEGLSIEVGHGCKTIEWQLAEHVKRVFLADGRDRSKALLLKLRSNSHINQEKLAEELVARNLLSHAAAAATRAFDEFLPAGSPN